MSHLKFGIHFSALLASMMFIAVGASARGENSVLVRLKKEQTRMMLQGSSLRIGNSFQCGSSCSVQIWHQGLKKVKLQVMPDGPSWQISESTIKISGQQLRIGSQLVPNTLRLHNFKKSFDIVAEETLDEYLMGVVSSEMPKRWPLETLKAQAVAARSYTMAVMAERRGQSFHVESSVMDQVFKKSHFYKDDYRLVREAVRGTRGQVLRSSRGNVLKAFYHADCGGETRTAQEVWGAPSEFGTAKDPFCQQRARSKWTLQVSKSQFKSRLQKLVGMQFSVLPDLGWSSQLQSYSDLELRYKGRSVTIAANDLRASLGFDKLKSTKFSVQEKGEQLEFSGQGFGHGVGLCQWGSKELGERGHSYAQILRHYYPNSYLRN